MALWTPAITLLEFFSLRARYVLIIGLFLLPQLLSLAALSSGSGPTGAAAGFNGQPVMLVVLLLPVALSIYLLCALFVMNKM